MSSGFTRNYKNEPFKVTFFNSPMLENVASLAHIEDGRKKDEVGIWVDYFRLIEDKGSRIEMRFGSPTWVHYDNGLVGLSQCDRFDSVEEAREFIETKRKTVNNWYVCFGIRKTSLVDGNLVHESVMDCEGGNVVGVLQKH